MHKKEGLAVYDVTDPLAAQTTLRRLDELQMEISAYSMRRGTLPQLPLSYSAILGRS